MERKPPLTRSGEPRAFFGRRVGKTLRARQQGLVDRLLPEMQVDFDTETGELATRARFLNPGANLILEIGYGGGEHLARLATENPDRNFIGAEVFSGGIGKILEKIDAMGIGNIRLFTADALDLLRGLPDDALEGVYLIYPDPWPKRRHHKRRFVSPTSLAELARTIKAGGFFRFATDIEDYANWTLAHVIEGKVFSWQSGPPASWHQPFAGWQPTRYEAKARREGRSTSFYFSFLRP